MGVCMSRVRNSKSVAIHVNDKDGYTKKHCIQGRSLRINDQSIDKAFMLNNILYQTCLIFCHFITAITWDSCKALVSISTNKKDKSNCRCIPFIMPSGTKDAGKAQPVCNKIRSFFLCVCVTYRNYYF